MKTDYLVESANEMYRLVGQNPEPNSDDLHSAAFAGCKSLKILLDDQGFFGEVQEFRSRRDRNVEGFLALTSDLAYFVEMFAKTERKVLIEAGLDSELTDHLLEEA